MESLISPLILAVFGILGTLLSPIVTVRVTARMQRELADQQSRQARELRDRDDLNAALAAKRACYVTVNSSARWYRIAQMNYLHALHEDRLQEDDRNELHAARRAYAAELAEGQLVASRAVLGEMEIVFSGLSRTFQRIKRLERGDAEEGGSFDEIRTDLLALWEKWIGLRDAMRQDLGTHKP
ncbi:hypothetical protein [Streptomyces sp. NPDC008141]|uniref:hypothetical protein n=1 Tax=Streptomyces sp. NPDC008141 TaxID=3364815 RepID=UPI0036EFCB23